MQRTAITLLVLTTAALAHATAPSSYAVNYGLHAKPWDPNSPLTFAIELDLSRSATLYNSIGWHIGQVTIRQYSSGDVVNTWSATDPNCPTADGLWWTTHADPNSPQYREFELPPHLVGTAASADPNVAALNYDFHGVTVPRPIHEPYAATTFMDYSLQLEGESAPLAEGDEEPTDTGPLP